MKQIRKEGENARSVAMRILTEVITHKQSLSERLDKHLPDLRDKRDRPLAQALCYCVMRWLPRLQAILDCLLTRPLKNKDADIHALLLIGLCQHLYMRIPPHAATYATVNVAHVMGKSRGTGLINAVLRNFQRRRESLLAVIDEKPEARLAHPAWLLECLQQEWPADWERIAMANNAHPPMTLRVNKRQCSREIYLEHLNAAGYSANIVPYSSQGLTLSEALDVESLPGFAEGRVSVQDGAAQLAAELLQTPPEARVLDACAAPGGKTAHLLETQTDARLVAVDESAPRLQRLSAALQRLKLSAELCCADAGAPETWQDGRKFERILLDAPCSGSGVIRRHPDIKHLRRPADIPALAARQKQLLEALWPLLVPGGLLLYVTCSVFAAENQRLLETFLSEHPDAGEQTIEADWGRSLGAGRQILPGEDQMDGFYYARLCKH
ncbi:MAG: 16S rRNA (cytosine(967)-C(5))-methyltransferase RsmB [Gammaproteobacteria bacterium]|nr:16S rRNA (cytosine(967)-C(5))-methyltransferase RsmB [Gammaproteobacteria bacterium]